MKKLVVYLLVLSMLVVTAMGCVNQNQPTDESIDTQPTEAPSITEEPAQEEAEDDTIYTLQFSTTMAAETFGVAEIVDCMKKIEELTNGHVKFATTFNGSLGDETELLVSVMDGSLDLIIAGPGTLAAVDPAFDIYNTPFLYDNYDHALAFWNSDAYSAWLKAHGDPLGITFITTINQGFSGILNNKRDVYSPDDLTGLKLRVPDQASLIALCNSMGAVATPIAASEQYTALSQGVIEGAVHSMAAHVSWGLTEIAGHFTETNHMLACGMVEMNTEKLNSLPDEYRTIILEQFQECQNTIFQNTVASVATDYAKAESDGTKIILSSEVDMDAFRAKLADLIEQYKAIAPDFYDSAKATQY